MDRTLCYYETNADAFVQSTRDVDLHSMQDIFLSKLRAGSHILDLGCGSGRDTRYFMEKGYIVTAVDGSAKMCRLAAAYTGSSVRQMLFQELDDVDRYEGIWACSSILHLPFQELAGVLAKMATASKPAGIVYTSFKYGSFEGERNGRYFTDMTEERLGSLLEDIGSFTLEDLYVTSDVRPGRGDEKWLNVIMRKG